MSSPILNYSSSAALASTSLFITRLDINSRANLQAIDTTLYPLGTVFQFISGDGSSSVAVVAELQGGPANPADSSQVSPDNYNSTSNDKHWQVVAGLLP